MQVKAEGLVPVGWHIPEQVQQHAHIGSGGELLIEGVAAVCELDVHIQLHQAAHLQTQKTDVTASLVGQHCTV